MVTGGEILKRKLADPIATELVGWQFPHHDRLFQVFDDKMQQLFEGGIIEYHYADFYKKLKSSNIQESDEPQVLTMDLLEAGFVVWVISISLTALTLICEWLIKLRYLLLVKYIFRAYYQHKWSEAATCKSR